MAGCRLWQQVAVGFPTLWRLDRGEPDIYLTQKKTILNLRSLPLQRYPKAATSKNDIRKSA